MSSPSPSPTAPDATASSAPVHPAHAPVPVSSGRVFAGGLMMGLANLVPGVSGGTMILALGLYDRFIGSIAAITRLRLTRDAIVFLVIVALGAGISIVGLATPAVWLVTEQRWIAYSLFIGMTLGGVPLLLRVVRPFGPKEVASTLLGVLVMAGVAWFLSGSPLPQNALVFVVVGAVAASSMILPGISGSYLLLVFGLYDVIVGSLRLSSLREDLAGSLAIIVPVGIGAVIGMGLLSNVLKFALTRYERPSHGFLLGLLLGSVLGLLPYQRPVHPDLVDKHGVRAVEALLGGASVEQVHQDFGVSWDAAKAAELRRRYAGLDLGDLKLKGLELERYRPTVLRVALSLLLLAVGFAITRALGTDEPPAEPGPVQ